MRNFKLSAGDFEISLIPATGSANCNIEFLDEGQVISSVLWDDFSSDFVNTLTVNGDLSVKINPVHGVVRLAGLIVEEK